MLWEHGLGAPAQIKLPGRNDTGAVIKDQWKLGKREEEGKEIGDSQFGVSRG